MQKKIIIGVSCGLAAILAVVLLALCAESVPAGHRGVLTTFGKPSSGVLPEGLIWVLPIGQQVNLVEVRTNKMQMESGAASKDLQVVHTTIAVNFHVIADEADRLFINIGPAYQDRIIAPAVQESFKAVTAQFTVEELITSRERVRAEMQALIASKLSESHLIIEGVSIMNFDFSPQFNHAIEQKQIAEQDALKAKYELAQKKIEAEQLVVSAEAQKRARIEAATGEAESIRLKAAAESEAQKLINSAATEKTLLFRAIEKWNGEMPRMLSKDAMPMIQFSEVGAK